MWWPDDINSTEGNKLYDVMVMHSLSQFIHEPTRITPISKSCLDLLFTNTPGYILKAEVIAPIFGSDHSTIITSVDFKNINVESPSTRRVWKYHLTVIDELNQAISNYDWDTILSIPDVNIMTSNFTNHLFDIFNSFIPHHDKVLKFNDGPWFNQRIKNAIIKRDKLEVVNNIVRESKESYRSNLCDSLGTLTSGNKNYWCIIKKLLGNKFSFTIPSLENNGISATSNNEKASMFLNKFLGKFQHNYNVNKLPVCPSRTRILINNVNIDRAMVHKLLKELDVSKSNGNDNISNKMLKMVADSIDTLLYRLFSMVITTCQFPDSWKLGTIVPIFKNKGSRNAVSNYRPVTLTLEYHT
jgi:hypothetical protein